MFTQVIKNLREGKKDGQWSSYFNSLLKIFIKMCIQTNNKKI